MPDALVTGPPSGTTSDVLAWLLGIAVVSIGAMFGLWLRESAAMRKEARQERERSESRVDAQWEVIRAHFVEVRATMEKMNMLLEAIRERVK